MDGPVSRNSPFSIGHLRSWCRDQPGDAPKEIVIHPSQFSSLDVSSSGAVAVSAWNGRVLWFSDALNQKPYWLPDEIDSIAVSPQGDFVVSGARDHTARLWDLATGYQRFEWNPDSQPVRAVAVSNDGRRIALGGKSIRIIDAMTGTELKKIQLDKGYIRVLKFAPDDSRLVAGTHIDATSPAASDGRLLTWSTKDWSEYQDWPNVAGEGVWAMIYSPDGRWFAHGGTSGRVTLRDAAIGAVIQSLPHGAGWISSLSFSSDSKHLAAGCWDASGKKAKSVPIRIWDVRTTETLQELEGHSLAVFALDYSSDGKRLLSGGSAGDLRLWDTADYTLRARIELPKTGWVHSARFTPDGKSLLSITGRQRNACEILLMRSEQH
jgi:WD40 repeat protein